MATRIHAGFVRAGREWDVLEHLTLGDADASRVRLTAKTQGADEALIALLIDIFQIV